MSDVQSKLSCRTVTIFYCSIQCEIFNETESDLLILLCISPTCVSGCVGVCCCVRVVVYAVCPLCECSLSGRTRLVKTQHLRCAKVIHPGVTLVSETSAIWRSMGEIGDSPWVRL